MSRYDYLYVHAYHFRFLRGDEMDDLWGLEFQTQDLDREFLEYTISRDGSLSYQDFHYELVDNDGDGLFSKSLRAINDSIVKSYYTGDIVFYGKPYEHMYVFCAKMVDGYLESIRLISKQ